MNTMNRCTNALSDLSRATFFVASLALLAWTFTGFHSNAHAQDSVREFPRTALRGELVITAPPEARVDGRVARLSPGARIRGPQNQLVMSGAIAGQPLTVNYVRDGGGMIHDVWILTASEAALKRPTAVPERNFAFESDAQKAPTDDGKTPYNQLPGYPKR
jgi:hypothetical protein